MTHLDPNGIYRWGEAASSITDRNGNQIVATGTGIIGYRDALGRQVLAWSGIGNNGDTVSVAGLAMPFTLHWASATETFPEQMTNLGPGACTLGSGGSSAHWSSLARGAGPGERMPSDLGPTGADVRQHGLNLKSAAIHGRGR